MPINQFDFDSAVNSLRLQKVPDNTAISNVGELYKLCEKAAKADTTQSDLRLFSYGVVQLGLMVPLLEQGGSAAQAFADGKTAMTEVNNFGPGVTPGPWGPQVSVPPQPSGPDNPFKTPAK